MAVGSCDWAEIFRDGLGDGLDFSVTVAGDDLGLGLGLLRGPAWEVVVRCWVLVVAGVTFLPGVVTESEVAVVVVVVVVSVWPSIWRRT